MTAPRVKTANTAPPTLFISKTSGKQQQQQVPEKTAIVFCVRRPHPEAEGLFIYPGRLRASGPFPSRLCSP